MKSISVIIGTYGDIGHWSELARRAVRSAQAQTFEPEGIYYNHGLSLHEARNEAAERAAGEWLCFLDADDELHPDYLRHMTVAIESSSMGWDLLLQPATLGVVNGREDPVSCVIPKKPLLDGNYMVIGTVVRRSSFLYAGGFRDFPCYEDWDLWIRMALNGARHVAVPLAVYRVHVSQGSRNNGSRDEQVQVYKRIRNEHTNHPKARSI